MKSFFWNLQILQIRARNQSQGPDLHSSNWSYQKKKIEADKTIFAKNLMIVV